MLLFDFLAKTITAGQLPHMLSLAYELDSILWNGSKHMSLFQNERQKIFVIPGKCNATRNPGSFLDYRFRGNDGKRFHVILKEAHMLCIRLFALS
jgi:hypothetical protein